MKTTQRRTKAQRAYQMLCEAAYHLKMISVWDLAEIAKAINPEHDRDRDGRVLVVAESYWTDGSLSPMLTVLSGGSAGWGRSGLGDELMFYREQKRRCSTDKVRYDVRLIYEFDRAQRGGRSTGKVWLDYESGLPWVPRSIAAIRSIFNEAEREEKRAFNESDSRKARAALMAMNRETKWLHREYDNARECWREYLEERERRDYWGEWRTVRVLAEKIHPAGTDVPKEDRAEFQAKYRAKQLAEMEAAA